MVEKSHIVLLALHPSCVPSLKEAEFTLGLSTKRPSHEQRVGHSHVNPLTELGYPQRNFKAGGNGSRGSTSLEF